MERSELEEIMRLDDLSVCVCACVCLSVCLFVCVHKLAKICNLTSAF